MECVNLSETTGRAKYFQQGVLLNLQYWQDWVNHKIDDVTALDQERNSIIRGILFALDLGEAAWSSVQSLISTLSSFMERRGYWEIWHQVLDKALKVAKLVGDMTGMTHLSALLGRLSFQQSHFQESVSYYRQTIRLARQIGDRFNEARACTNLGYYYIERGQWWRAEVLCQYALQIFEQIDNNHGRAHTHNHLGFLYTWQRRWELAQWHLEQACEIWQAMNDGHGLMRGFTNLGGLYLKMERSDMALSYLEKALREAKLVGEEETIGRIYINMSAAHILSRNFTAAERDTRQAEAIFRRFSNIAELARVWGNLGVIYFHQNEWSEALLHLEKSLQIWRDLKKKEDEISTLMDLIEVELGGERRQQALAHLEELEILIGQDQVEGQYNHLQPRLTKYQAELET